MDTILLVHMLYGNTGVLVVASFLVLGIGILLYNADKIRDNNEGYKYKDDDNKYK